MEDFRETTHKSGQKLQELEMCLQNLENYLNVADKYAVIHFCSIQDCNIIAGQVYF